MENIPTNYLRQLHGCLGGIAYELRVQYLSVPREQSWTPAMNAYRCHDRILVCLDLAGVSEQDIELIAEPRRLLIRGTRQPLDTHADLGPALQVFALEIDQGVFQREIPLPLTIDPDHVRAEQRNGLLWIHLPIAS
jgi:HSP20 family protein